MLKHIPTATLVGITGGLSMNNTDKEDDIDFLIVSIPHAMWVTRFLAVCFVGFVAKRRTPSLTKTGNAVCLNMFMTTDNLAISPDKRDIYLSHEITQMIPLWSRESTYKRFLMINSWVGAMLPFVYKKRLAYAKTFREEPFVFMTVLMRFLFSFFDVPAKIFQRWYMRRRHTVEIVTDTRLEFHPKDARGWIRKKLTYSLKRYGIPLDKVWFYPLQ